MMIQLNFNQLTIPPGSQLLVKEVDWLTFEHLLEQLGEKRAVKLSYSQGLLEIMTPLLEHEDDKNILSDLVKILLEELNIEFRAVGSTTFKNKRMAQAIEPDECFYIEHEQAIRGKKRVDLTVDPPPDLAIEIDITTRTHLGNYEALEVPELWRYDGQQLFIYILQQNVYIESDHSLHFPQLPLHEAIPYHLKYSKEFGRNATMKLFRHWLHEKMRLS
ncbi:MAG: hypothetical protein BWK79_15445 [Beggiatoa sp. IS2]|nr:MAG: hypothetical protein BWK79_15445 [Beggiatoa sp. IS2]